MILILNILRCHSWHLIRNLLFHLTNISTCLFEFLPCCPHRGLDLSKYTLGQHDAAGAPPMYDLYAVINHHGGILGGHYTAYVRCADTVDSLKSEVGELR